MTILVTEKIENPCSNSLNDNHYKQRVTSENFFYLHTATISF